MTDILDSAVSSSVVSLHREHDLDETSYRLVALLGPGEELTIVDPLTNEIVRSWQTDVASDLITASWRDPRGDLVAIVADAPDDGGPLRDH